MKKLTLLFDIFFLVIFLTASIYSYAKFKSAANVSKIKQNLFNLSFTADGSEISIPKSELPLPEGTVPAPALVFPLDGDFFYNGPGCEDVRFLWQPDASSAAAAVSYTFRISTRADLRRPLVEETVRVPALVLPAARLAVLPERTYYWGVSQTDFEGERSNWSESRSFSAGLKQPDK
ncbi:MAG: hypothetical protein LBG72_08150 [Spirochaetaceae bacterium]|jgi:hypothetical protein|nr:hypothetical protein [Spirochaetaceae bacterium]